ncbi:MULTISPECIES: protein phosphatase 2C domain-containing protein [unclassified Streptomyces]|uniref:PP2C family protein-serine/threonine phosphatase n=1 Tax=unclassified Streptomyces TaxID=2593676 RepID=UPI0013719176|nr:protein phosphatase 2C domain-containing protein [Streptomyces sp. SID4982]MYS18503.1 SpoIIE family protein phosphatase [Streptomyces sp. SID4982]
MSLTLQFTIRSDKGLVREVNEDSVYAAPHLLVVADGMGGHAGGEVASSVVISHMAELGPERTRAEPMEALREAILAGNLAIAEAVRASPELDGMGTTITAVLMEADSDQFIVANVGDSRTYLMRAGELVLLTRDDSLVQTLLDDGRITAAEALAHPQRSMVTKALVGGESLSPALFRLETLPGDRFLLCSDGLSDLVAESELAVALGMSGRDDAADRLVELALGAGGNDNVSVVVADVVHGDAYAPDDAAPVISRAPLQEDTAAPARRGRKGRTVFVLAAVVVAAAVAVYLLG